MLVPFLLALLLGVSFAEQPDIRIVSGRVETKIRSDATTQVVEKLTLYFANHDFTYGRRNIFCGVKGRASNITDLSVRIDGVPYLSASQGAMPGTVVFNCSTEHCASYSPDCTAQWYYQTPRRGSFCCSLFSLSIPMSVR
jgi:hypothetical protein